MAASSAALRSSGGSGLPSETDIGLCAPRRIDSPIAAGRAGSKRAGSGVLTRDIVTIYLILHNNVFPI
jgi:hypothetical protein